MKWAHFLHADTNLGKLNVDLIIIGWVCSKMDETFKIIWDSTSGALTNNLMNLVDWLNDFCTGLTTSLLWIFDICWVSTAVVLVKNDVLFLVPTGRVLKLGFPEFFLIKAWLSVERLFPVKRIREMTKNLGAHPAWLLNPHNSKILAFLLYGHHSPQFENIAIPAIAFSLHNFKLLPTC